MVGKSAIFLKKSRSGSMGVRGCNPPFGCIMYSTTSIIRTLINWTFRLSKHGHKSHTYTTMYKSTSFIRTVTYPNSFVQVPTSPDNRGCIVIAKTDDIYNFQRSTNPLGFRIGKTSTFCAEAVKIPFC